MIYRERRGFSSRKYELEVRAREPSSDPLRLDRRWAGSEMTRQSMGRLERDSTVDGLAWRETTVDGRLRRDSTGAMTAGLEVANIAERGKFEGRSWPRVVV